MRTGHCSHRREAIRAVSLGGHMAAAEPKPTKQDVTIAITGGFRTAGVIVEKADFELSENLKGTHSIDILPPTLDVELHVFTPVPCKFEMTVSLNGVELKEAGVVKEAGHFTQLFQYKLSKFNLSGLTTAPERA